jgi:hypothetical protein
MKFDMNNLNPGTWFYFDQDDESGGAILLRVCPQGEVRRINNLCTKKPVKFRKNQPYVDKEVDTAQEERLLWDYCIVDWKDIEDANGVPIECTQDTKDKLMQGDPGFSEFVAERMRMLREVGINKEDLEKNLSNTQDEL